MRCKGKGHEPSAFLYERNIYELRCFTQFHLLLQGSGRVVQHTIHHSGYSEHSSNNGTDTRQKVCQRLLMLRELDHHG